MSEKDFYYTIDQNAVVEFKEQGQPLRCSWFTLNTGNN
jgi:hypothetical protein